MVNTIERRDRQRDALVLAAERAVAEKGSAGLKARDLAAEIGVALGAIYNLVENMDELVLRIGSRTLGRLDAALTEATAGGTPSPSRAVEQLVAIALTYCAFARDNLRLWRLLFEHRMDDSSAVPEWSEGDQLRLFRHILGPLSALTPDCSEQERALLARTLFSAVHGIVSIGLEDRLVAVPRDALDRQIETLVRLVCAGLECGAGPV